METCTEERNTDLKLRLKLIQKVRRKLPKNFWTERIRFFLDGACFTYKINPFDQTRAPTAMAWRSLDQGLNFGFTTEGRHEETGGSVIGKAKMQLNNIMVELTQRNSHL